MDVSNNLSTLLGIVDEPVTQDVKKGTLRQEDFFKLMFAQLANQDPLSPVSNSEFVAQMAQFTQLEETVNLRVAMEASLLATEQLNATSTVGFLGRRVQALGDTVELTAESPATLFYSLGDAATEVSIHVFSADGQKVKTIDIGEESAGTHTALWDGTTDSGLTASPGTYQFAVLANDLQGAAVFAQTFFDGVVTGINFDGDKPQVLVGAIRIPVDDIIEVQS